MKFKGSIATLALASIFTATAPAQAAGLLTNWFVDTDGAGGNAAVLVNDYLDLNGTAYVNNTFTSGTTFNFNEYGTFITNLADSVTPLSPQLDSTIFATGSGTTGGQLLFNTGTLEIFSGMNSIATFNLITGSAVLNAGTVLPNGAVSLIFVATALDAGYFFDSALVDLSTLLIPGEEIVLGFSTTNVISLANGVRTVTPGLVTGYNTIFNPDVGPVIIANNTTDLFIGNNGQFRAAIPEPGSLALLGIGLMGLAFGKRRSK